MFRRSFYEFITCFASYILSFVLITISTGRAAQADLVPSGSLAPINLAQAGVPPQFVPTDLSPYTTYPERNEYSAGYRFRAFQMLPQRLWFNFFTEVSQRLDTNVLFTYSKPKADYAFRVLPNLTIGYNIFRNTSIYGNYFLIKDVFARDWNGITFPTTQSVSWGLRHVKQLGTKTNLQLDFQARELWQTTHLYQFDFLPQITLSHFFSDRNIVYLSTLLQLRGGDYFVAPTREIDPYYTLGYIHRHGLWTFIATDTLVTNFRRPPFNDAVPNQSNMTMIADFELNHPLSRKYSGLLAFIRAEPIWNWSSNKVAGLSGFDFRLFTGLRLALNKPSYYESVDSMRKQLMGPDQRHKSSRSKTTTTTTTVGSPATDSNAPLPTVSPASESSSEPAVLH